MKSKIIYKIALAIFIVSVTIMLSAIAYIPLPDILVANPIDDIIVSILLIPISTIVAIISFPIFLTAVITYTKNTNKYINQYPTEQLLLEKAKKDNKLPEKRRTSECKICGAQADGFRLCRACYLEEQNKSNNRKYTTKTGKIVKSKSEILIDEHLYSKNYNYTYEEELFLEDINGNLICVHPDFCIYDNDKKIYIEYWGFSEKNKKYTEIKNEKLKLYERNNITLINLYETTDGERVREALDEKLANYEINKINY